MNLIHTLISEIGLLRNMFYILWLLTLCFFAQETKRLPLRNGVALIHFLSLPGSSTILRPKNDVP